MVKQIPLTQGKFALVDDEDFERVNQYKWQYRKQDGYAFRQPKKNDTNRIRYLHRFIMDVPVGINVDHINHDKLDNRRSNLRTATYSQNNQNLLPYNRKSKTGVRNVLLDITRKRKKYKVVLSVNGKSIIFGRYETLEEAAEVAKEARKTHMPFSPEARGE